MHPLPEGNGKPPGTTNWEGSVTEAGTHMRSYYGRQVIHSPVWKPQIPFYFFTGGLGGASAVLGYVARERGNDELADACTWISAIADAISPVLLVWDLGRPERFLNMLRVFKITSPMSVGSWVVAASGAATSAAVAAHLAGLDKLRNAAEAVSAVLGLPLSNYTAVLVSNTAVPIWHDGRHELPFVFATGSAGAAAAMVVSPERAGPARRLAVGSAVVEAIAMKVMEKRLGYVGEPYKKGTSGRLNKLTKACTLAGAAVLGLAGRRSRTAALAGGALMLVGEILLRWTVFEAGNASAMDPNYTVKPQRERVDDRGSFASSKSGRPRVPRAHGAG